MLVLLHTGLDNKHYLIPVSAFGEFGLDYSPSFPSKDAQLEWFEKQLELALEINKPMFLHEREAHDDMVRILAAAKARTGSLPPTVIHCFTGTKSVSRGVPVSVETSWTISLLGC